MAKKSGEQLLFSKRVYVYNLLIYTAPVAFFFCQLLLTGALSKQAFVSAFVSPVFIIVFAAEFLVSFFICRNITARIFAYDGSEKTLVTANKAAKIFPTVSIVMPILLNTVMGFLIRSSLPVSGDTFLSTSIPMQMTGSIFLTSLFCYILFIQNMERQLSFLPLRKEFLGMSMIVRNVLVSFFNVIGILCSTLAIFMALDGKLPLAEIIVQKVTPVGLFAVVMAILNFYRLSSGTSRRINVVNEFAERISTGDYSRSAVPVLSRDEFGILANNLNMFASSTITLVGDIQKAAESAKKLAAGLTDRMTETSQHSSRITADIASVSSGISGQSANVRAVHSGMRNIESTIDSLSAGIETQSSNVVEASAAVEQMVANIRSVTNILSKNTQVVSQLNAAAEEGQQKVGDAVEITKAIYEESEGLLEASSIIQHIAEQTNMLAMNAAIEAAHAGDAGRGFAVVADEIRKLAEDSNTQSKTISERLRGIGSSIGNVSKNTEEVQNHFGVIFELAKSVKNQEDVIMQAMQEQSSGSGQVLAAMNGIQEVTMMVKNGSSAMKDAAKTVSAEMNNLTEETTGIEKAADFITAGAKQITAAVEQAFASARENVLVAQTLERAVGKFKIRQL